MKFERTRVWGFENALHGMRNPMESYHLSDTTFESGEVIIGKNDMKLAQKLIRGGACERKFLRQIFVSVDITAPLYFFKELDTYKVGTTANSTSTMHKLASTPIAIDCFEMDDYHDLVIEDETGYSTDLMSSIIISDLEKLRKKYLETKDKRYWKELIRWLPEGWLQRRTVTMTYENLLAMCSRGQRRFHKLNEWSGKDDPTLPNFISWVRTLPYAQELIFIDEIETDEQKAKNEKMKLFNEIAKTAEEKGISFEEILKMLEAA